MPAWRAWLKIAFFALVVRPLVLFVIGFNIRHQHRLPRSGPLLLVANHNSHLDTLVLMSLLPLRRLPEVRPVAAADYFLTGPVMSWFATHMIGIIPIARRQPGNAGPTLSDASADLSIDPTAPADPVADVLAGTAAALAEGAIVILYPEGTRGEPEAMQDFKSGVARLAERCPAAAVQPVFLHGLGKALPKGSLLPVPFFCDVVVGEPIPWPGSRRLLMEQLRTSMQRLAAECRMAEWQ